MTSRFQLPAVPATTPKNIRFPNDIIEQVERTIEGTNLSFSRFVIEATRAALGSMREEVPSDVP